MINETLKIELLTDKQKVPYDLLRLADPSRKQIDTYIKSGQCFIATWNAEIVASMVLDELNSTSIEIKNIAVKESFQRKGIGKSMLRYASEVCGKSGYEKLIIGTGNSSIHQLALYQKEGFEISHIKKDFFLEHYQKPIFENGIQCKHMILLEKDLGE